MPKSNRKKTTANLIESAIARQNSWLKNRRNYTRKFLKELNTFACKKKEPQNKQPQTTTLRAYWFPIMCAFIVLILAIFVVCVRVYNKTHAYNQLPIVPEPIIQPVAITNPTFDIVRIEKDGKIVVAGRWKADKTVSVYMNDKIIASIRCDDNGEFVYSSVRALNPGNYTLYLVGTEPYTQSETKVFLYVPDTGYENAVSLIMTTNGSSLMQSPKTMADSGLVVSKIDYLSDGRLIVTGDGMPRLRVSLELDGKYLGFARVSNYKHFGLGADVGNLQPGNEYVLSVRLHDDDGNTVAMVKHKFIMPEMTGDDDTFYTVRRGDCLWVIARNFMRRGILFSIIAERNNIENPDLIFPKQKLEIPVLNK
ncbi:MAG: LysM peptidoglycan-binding domain-containing protein [Alphaproteobacteria bacterium]|nr:LysM peptidoglycan-binding domain-containing protein [Alphaproteobacteria bacterium]